MKAASRDPSEKIKKLLRQEVNFGCPVRGHGNNGCGCPILTFHHFDPPWSGNQVHNPDGMIALCHTHHDQADGGLWTNAQLRMIKKSPFIDDVIKVPWPWNPETLVLKVGPVFVVRSGSALVLNGKPVLSFHADLIDRLGIKSIVFNSNIIDVNNRPWITIKDNFLDIETSNVSDLFFTPQTKKFVAKNKSKNMWVSLQFKKKNADNIDKWLVQFMRPGEKSRKLGKTKFDLAEEIGKTISEPGSVDTDGNISFLEIKGMFQTPEAKFHVTEKLLKMHVSPAILGKGETVNFHTWVVSEEHHMSLRYDSSRHGGREWFRMG